MQKERRLYTPQLSESNVRGLYRTAQKFDFAMTKLLNLIVSAALVELENVDADEWTVCAPGRLEEPHDGSPRPRVERLPVRRDKKPYVSWKEYQDRFPTDEERTSWHDACPDANVGIVTGKISNLTVIDVERGGETGHYPPTFTVTTGGGGWHLYYTYHPMANKARIAPLTDIRGDGGYVVAPGSIHESGTAYTVLTDVPLEPFPAHLFSVQSPCTVSTLINGVSRGSRNAAAAVVAGKLIRAFRHEPDTAWQTLFYWNQSNEPPLTKGELETVFESILNRERAKPHRTEVPMALDEKRRLLFDKVFMAFGSQMHACEHNPVSDDWQKFRQDAWLWAIRSVSEFVEFLYREPDTAVNEQNSTVVETSPPLPTERSHYSTPTRLQACLRPLPLRK